MAPEALAGLFTEQMGREDSEPARYGQSESDILLRSGS
jgi:hypothetical protein